MSVKHLTGSWGPPPPRKGRQSAKTLVGLVRKNELTRNRDKNNFNFMMGLDRCLILTWGIERYVGAPLSGAPLWILWSPKYKSGHSDYENEKYCSSERYANRDPQPIDSQ